MYTLWEKQIPQLIPLTKQDVWIGYRTDNHCRVPSNIIRNLNCWKDSSRFGLLTIGQIPAVFNVKNYICFGFLHVDICNSYAYFTLWTFLWHLPLLHVAHSHITYLDLHSSFSFCLRKDKHYFCSALIMELINEVLFHCTSMIWLVTWRQKLKGQQLKVLLGRVGECHC